MPDSVEVNGNQISADYIEAEEVYQERVKLTFGADGEYVDVSDENPVPVEVTNFPEAVTEVEVSNFPATQNVAVQGTVPVDIQDASITVAGPLPVTDNGGSLTVDGIVAVSNFPADFDVGNFPESQVVEGTVDVGNFPATQNVAVVGTVPVDIQDASIAVTGPLPVTDNGGSLTVDGSVNVGNFPTSFEVSNFPEGGGEVEVSNFPATYPVTDNGGSLTVDGAVAVSGAATSLSGSGANPIPSTEVRGYGSLSVQCTSGTANVQFSNDNTNWVLASGWVANASASYGAYITNLSSTYGVAVFPVNGRYFKVTGTATVTVELSPFPPTIMPVDGTVVQGYVRAIGTSNPTDSNSNSSNTGPQAMNLLYNGSSWERQRSVAAYAGTLGATAIAGAATELSGSASANSTDLVASTDVRAYKSWSLQLTGTWSASVQIQTSNDNSNWSAIPGIQAAGTVTFTPSQTYTNNAIYVGPIVGRYVRVRTTAYSSGTVTATLELSAEPYSSFSTYVNGFGANVGISGNVGISQISSTANNGADATANLNGGLLAAMMMAYNGATWDRVRHPNTLKTTTATASGNSACWTPTSSKKFRLMRYRIDVTNNVTLGSAGELDITFQDASTGMPIGLSLYVPASIDGGTGAFTTGWVDLGNGILSAAANNVLNINLSAALTAGKVRVNVAGTEE